MAEYYSCQAIEGGFHFKHKSLALCCVTHSGNKAGPRIADYRGGDLPLDKILTLRRQLRGDNQRQVDTPCKGCPLLVRRDWPEDDHRFNKIGIGHFSGCNLSCVYCQTTSMSPELLAYKHKPLYQLYPVFDSLIRADRLAPRCEIDWGGGEPTILEEYERLMDLLLHHGAQMSLYSNATVHSEATARGLASRQVTLVCSIDAGTRETYRAMKRRDLFDKVCENLADYAARGVVIAKYIVTDQNCQERDLVGFVELVRSKGMKAIHISRDWWQGVLSKKVIRAMAFLAVAALKHKVKFLFHPVYVTPSERLLAKGMMAEILAEQSGFDPDTSWAKESRFFDGEDVPPEGNLTIEDVRRQRDEARWERDRLAASAAYRIGSRITRAARDMLTISGVGRWTLGSWARRTRRTLTGAEE